MEDLRFGVSDVELKSLPPQGTVPYLCDPSLLCFPVVEIFSPDKSTSLPLSHLDAVLSGFAVEALFIQLSVLVRGNYGVVDLLYS